MQKKFVSNLLLLLFLNFLIKPVWIFGIDLTVQNRVGTGEYGLYFALFNFSLIFNILLDFGLTHYNNQAVAKNKVEVVRNFSNLTTLKLLLGLVYIIVTLAVGMVAGYDGLAFYLLSILSLNQFLASLILFLRSNLSGLQFFRADSILSVVDKTLMILICALLLFSSFGPLGFTVIHFAFAQTISYIITVFIAFFLVWKKVRIFKWKINFSEYRKGLQKSFPYALLILLMALYTRVDGIMLDRLVSSYESGIYAAAFRLLDMVNQMSYLFGILLLPMYSGMIGRKENMSALTRLSFSVLFTILLAITIISCFNAPFIIEWLYVTEDTSINTVFILLMISSLAFGTTFIFGTLLTAAAELKILNITAVFGFSLNIILNLLLIPEYGAEGAAVATLFTQTLTALVQVFFCFRKVRINFSGNYWIKTGVLITGSVLWGYMVNRLSLPFVYNVLLVLAVVVSLSVFLKLLKYKSAIDLFMNRFR